MTAAHTFPAGHFVLHPHHVELWTSAVSDEPVAGVLPSIALLICFRGAGASIGDIMQVLRTDPGNVLFGEIALEFDSPFRAGAAYTVETSIIGSERKHGRSLGTFDKVTLRYTLLEADRRIAEVTQIWMVSRGEE